MISRIGLALAGLAATLVLAAGIAAAGIGPFSAVGSEAVDAGTPEQATTGASTDTGDRSVTETVYVRPAPKPKVVHVTRRVRSDWTSTSSREVRSRQREDRERGEREDRERGEREGRERGEDD
jgi:hypothetical protein